jgi:hypothetical protein
MGLEISSRQVDMMNVPATPPRLAALAETRASIGVHLRPPMAVLVFMVKAANYLRPPSKTAIGGLNQQQLLVRYVAKTAKSFKSVGNDNVPPDEGGPAARQGIDRSIERFAKIIHGSFLEKKKHYAWEQRIACLVSDFSATSFLCEIHPSLL